MSQVDLDARLTVSEGVVWREVGGEAVILELTEGQYFGLDETGTLMWKSVLEGKALRGIVKRVTREFDVSHRQAEADLLALVGRLIDAGLLVAE